MPGFQGIIQKNAKKLAHQEFRLRANKAGLEWLDNHYVNSQTRYHFCCKGCRKPYEAVGGSVSAGHGCAVCNRSRVSERVCRAWFEKIFDKPFPQATPKWLKQSKTGSRHLDGFNKDMNLAFEYHGLQHFKPVAHFNRTKSVEEIQADDRSKQKICEQQGVVLIIIPYYVRHSAMGRDIISKC